MPSTIELYYNNVICEKDLCSNAKKKNNPCYLFITQFSGLQTLLRSHLLCPTRNREILFGSFQLFTVPINMEGSHIHLCVCTAY